MLFTCTFKHPDEDAFYVVHIVADTWAQAEALGDIIGVRVDGVIVGIVE